MSRADDSSWPYSLFTTTLYVPDNSVDAEVIVSFMSRPLKEIIISFDALTTVDSLYITTRLLNNENFIEKFVKNAKNKTVGCKILLNY